MATQTQNIRLTKPDLTESADILVINTNMDIIDQRIGNPAELVTDARENLVDAINEATQRGYGGTGLSIIDFFSTFAELEATVLNPSAGDAYGVGDSMPFDIYIFGLSTGWVNNGPIVGPPGQDGQNGKDGKDGKDGIDGQDGLDGQNGRDGLDGAKGDPGYAEYTATYSNNVISLTKAGDNSPVFIFTAPVDYASGMTFNVNGTTTPATTVGGKPLPDGAFVTGDVLIVSKGVNGINFRLGGGVGFNYRIITVADENSLPTAVQENTITVPYAVSEHFFQSTQPNATPANGLWIQTGLSSDLAFNALIKNSLMIDPISVYRSNGTAWINITSECRIYQNSKWNRFGFVIYSDGDEFTAVTGGWTGTFVGTNVGMGASWVLNKATRGTSYIHSKRSGGTNGNVYLDYAINNIGIDTSPYSMLCIDLENNSLGASDVGVRIFNSKSPTSTITTKYTKTSGRQVLTVDISSINTLAYFLLQGQYAAPGDMDFKIYDVWMA